MMTPSEMEQVLRDVDVRTSTIEQILPRLATKEDLTAFATKDDLKAFATKEDLKAFATKEDLKAFATKDDLKALPTRTEMREELQAYTTRKDLDLAVTLLRAEIEETRRQARVLHEDVKADIRMLAEHLARVIERLDNRP